MFLFHATFRLGLLYSFHDAVEYVCASFSGRLINPQAMGDCPRQALAASCSARHHMQLPQCRLSLRRLAWRSGHGHKVSHMLRALQENNGQRGGLDPKLEMVVPADQRPVNELEQLRKGQLYSWVRDLLLLSASYSPCSGSPIAWQRKKYGPL